MESPDSSVMDSSTAMRNGTNSSSFATCIPEKTVGYYIDDNASRSNFILLAVVNSVLSCSGMILNITFIITVFKKRTLHTVTNMITSALSLNDFVTSLVVIPSYVYSTVFILQERPSCTLHKWAFVIASACISTSLLLVIAMSAEQSCHLLSFLVRSECNQNEGILCVLYPGNDEQGKGCYLCLSEFIQICWLEVQCLYLLLRITCSCSIK